MCRRASNLFYGGIDENHMRLKHATNELRRRELERFISEQSEVSNQRRVKLQRFRALLRRANDFARRYFKDPK